MKWEQEKKPLRSEPVMNNPGVRQSEGYAQAKLQGTLEIVADLLDDIRDMIKTELKKKK